MKLAMSWHSFQALKSIPLAGPALAAAFGAVGGLRDAWLAGYLPPACRHQAATCKVNRPCNSSQHTLYAGSTAAVQVFCSK